MVRRVGIVGYGALGQFLVTKILDHPDQYELVFIWNRSPDKIRNDPRIQHDLILEDLSKVGDKNVDIIVEVAHPGISGTFGALFLQHADYLVGSPTAFADRDIEDKLRAAAGSFGHGMYLATGALWGATDISKMAALGTLKGLTITMKKHPSSFKVHESLEEIVTKCLNSPQHDATAVIYEGPLRPLCPLAPNNVNTMACAALAASNLGFDGTQARLIADKTLTAHVIEVEIEGPTNQQTGDAFRVTCSRYNPAAVGAVTGSATYNSFWSSLTLAVGHGQGVHFC